MDTHEVRFGIGRMVCTCRWEFSIPFNRSMTPETVWKAYGQHMDDVVVKRLAEAQKQPYISQEAH